ncbi:hypothetical protein [Nocardiopsis baichengensis]|uniref:hypothetical protein n=1 Tax=Nocardiopsis baichengensis TaxID=280240 RepID=UPI00034C4C9B|nr:hypothetical protein [Nocardiopsis baichengensis]
MTVPPAELFFGAATELSRAKWSLIRAAGLTETAAGDMFDEPGQYYGHALTERIRTLFARLEAAEEAVALWEPLRPVGRDLPPLPELGPRPISSDEQQRRRREYVRRQAGKRLAETEADLRRAARRLRAVAAAGLRDEPMPRQARLEVAALAAGAEQLADTAGYGRLALSWCVPATRGAVWAERAARWRAGRAYWSWQRASRRAEAASAART